MIIGSIGLWGDNTSGLSSLFYADDGKVRSLDHEWLKNANHHLCNLFRECTGLKPNTEKTDSMSYHSGAIREWCLIEGYKRQHEGTGETYNKRKGERTVCSHSSCGKALVIGHRNCWWLVDKKPMRQQNGTYWYYPAVEAMMICEIRPI